MHCISFYFGVCFIHDFMIDDLLTKIKLVAHNVFFVCKFYICKILRECYIHKAPDSKIEVSKIEVLTDNSDLKNVNCMGILKTLFLIS